MQDSFLMSILADHFFFRLFIGAVVLFLLWDHIPAIVAWCVKKLFALVASIFAKTSSAVTPQPAPSNPVVTPAIDNQDPVTSLVNMTLWAVQYGSKEVLNKVTALFNDLQDANKKGGTDA